MPNQSATTFLEQARFVPVPRPARKEAAARALKRASDVGFAVAALLLLAPLFLLIAAMIKLDSPGPVLFRQRRIGRHGRGFGMLKFRTMVDGADGEKPSLMPLNEAEGGLFKIRRDPRVTWFGRILRSTSLDELPQLIHVLRGQMSIVGPRPLVASEDALISGTYRRRHDLRPGMTGAWQVAGASRIPLDRMAELDLEYLESWTPLGDLKLIVRTIPHVVLRRGV